MEKKNIGFELTIFASESEMTAAEAKLVQASEKARQSSYAPYSNFKVGAALLLEGGELILGSNQENASFPAGLCAEGVALFHAGANFPNNRIVAIAVSAAAMEKEIVQPAAPCGICRQSISEYEKKQNSPIAILMKGESGPIYRCSSISDLLPLGFDSSFL